jgi:hypothetical protein
VGTDATIQQFFGCAFLFVVALQEGALPFVSAVKIWGMIMMK